MHHVFDLAGDLAVFLGHKLPGPASLALTGVAAVLKATALMMRDHQKSVDEIVRDIRMPRKLDTTFRDDIDSRIQEKPE